VCNPLQANSTPLTAPPVLQTLDFTPNIYGQHAARQILSRLHTMDPEYDIIAHTKLEHEKLYHDLGWRNVWNVVFDVKPSVPYPYQLRAYLRPASATDAVGGSGLLVGAEGKGGRRLVTRSRGGSEGRGDGGGSIWM